MKKWLLTALIVAALVALSATARMWLSPSLQFLGANSTAIQTFSSLVQLLLWGGAGLAVILRLWKAQPKAAQPENTAAQEVRPPEITESRKDHRPRPALSALHQLPPPPRDFTGRAEELAELMREIERGGVTISGLRGQGGIGKTALALKLAEQLTPRYPDAQFYLDLRGHDQQMQQPLTPAEAMAHVLRAYYPKAKLPEDKAELRAQYLSTLHGQRALLLMDNARDDAQVTPLIPPADCILLVTSRQHFTLPGLYAKDLDKLPPEDARALLLKIAPRIGSHADEIARHCGQLPLALRLAASALAERKDLSAADYARRLTNSPQRLKLVEASLKLSYDLLNAELQQRWRTLAVFPATFDAAAAAAVWQADADAAQDALGELIKYSLLDWDDATARYNLHDLARLFADSRLSDAERRAAQARHAEHYVAVLNEAHGHYMQGGEMSMRGLALFDLEVQNVKAGQEWAARNTEGDDMAARLCFDYPDAGVYLFHLRLSPHEEARWFEQGLAGARKLNDRPAEGRSLGNLAGAYLKLNEFRRAVEFYEQCLAIAREIGDRYNEGVALGNLGVAYKNLGEPRRAIEFYEQYLTIAREIGTKLGEGHALCNLGIVYKQLGESHRAIEFYRQALALDREIGHRHGEAIVLWNMSLLLYDLGQRKQAIAHAEASLKIKEEIKDPYTDKVCKKLEEWRGKAG